MERKHNNWRRLRKRAWEEIKATAQIAKETSWPEAALTFGVKAEIQWLNRRNYEETPGATGRLLKKHEVMRRYFEKTYAPFLETYDFDKALPQSDPRLRDRIWICWWQGWEQAPEIVKSCVASVKRHAGGREVTLLTEANYREYVSIPDWLEAKYRAGIISRTHFSDVLRLSLLAAYGGLWLDATVFCTESLDACFASPIWSVKRPGYGHISVGCGGFVTGTMRCSDECRWIFAVFRDLLVQYWREKDFLVDYLLQDYLIDLAQRHDPRIKAAFAQIAPNQPGGDELLKVINQPYEEAVWRGLRQETALFILSWKRNFVKEQDGKETFYAKLCRGEL